MVLSLIRDGSSITLLLLTRVYTKLALEQGLRLGLLATGHGYLYRPCLAPAETSRTHYLLLGLSTRWRSTRKLRADANTVEMTLAMFWPTTTGRGVAANQPAATQNKALLTPMLRMACPANPSLFWRGL